MGRVSCSIDASQPLVCEMGGITMRQYFLDFKKSLEGQLRARDRIKEIYGLDVPVGLPGFSYHHISALGCEIVFPPNSDPAVKVPIFQSLEETEDFPEPDFLSSGTCPHFVRMCEYFASRLPESAIRPVFGAEGPITTAALLRGQDFFAEVMLYPDRVKDYMRRVSDSIAAFHRAVADFAGVPLEREAAGLCDDFAGMLPPDRYEELAVPATAAYYEVFGAKRRMLHCELLRKDHLRFLPQMGITFFDPGINQYLTPGIIACHTQVPFQWRYLCTDIARWTAEQLKDNYRRAVEQGASHIYMAVWSDTPLENVRAFMELKEELES